MGIYLNTYHSYFEEVEENEMGRACSTHREK
jgi:hypothetical protein